jgi:hypothetical protein
LESTRGKTRRGLSPLYLPAFDELTKLLGPGWLPYSGFRTVAKQDAIWAMGRAVPELPIRTYAKGGESPHNYGCASDWAPLDQDGHLWFPGIDDPTWDQYDLACQKVGLRNLNFEKMHNNLHVGVTWKQVNEVRLRAGMESAMAFIEAHLVV